MATSSRRPLPRRRLVSLTLAAALAGTGGYVLLENHAASATNDAVAAWAANDAAAAAPATDEGSAQEDRRHHRRRVITTDEAPAAIGPYSQAILVRGPLYASGMLPIDPATNTLLADGTIEEQTALVLSNLDAVLGEAGLTRSHVVSTTVYLSDLDDFARFNAEYEKFFGAQGAPARATVEVARVPRDAKVEIGLIAVR